MEGELYCCSSALVFKPTWGRRHPDKNVNYNYRIVIVHLISSPPCSSHAEESLHNTKYPVFRSRTRSRLSVWVFCRPAPAQQLPVAGCIEARLAASTRLVPSLLIWPPPACCDHTLASWGLKLIMRIYVPWSCTGLQFLNQIGSLVSTL